jgi:hypothetical protein
MVSFEGEAEDRVVAGSNPALGTADKLETRLILPDDIDLKKVVGTDAHVQDLFNPNNTRDQDKNLFNEYAVYTDT